MGSEPGRVGKFAPSAKFVRKGCARIWQRRLRGGGVSGRVIPGSTPNNVSDETDKTAMFHSHVILSEYLLITRRVISSAILHAIRATGRMSRSD